MDGRSAGKSDRLIAGTWLEVALPDPEPPAPIEGVVEQVAGLTVLYSDDDIVVVDKPVGVAAHPSPGWTGPTVIGGLAALGHRLSTSGADERQGIVHRLDAGTTGVMVVATSERAYTALKRAFKERTVDKRYHAVAQGHPDPSSGTIDAPIDRHPRHDHRFAVVADGRPSVTHYDTVEAFPAASLLDVHLETGRTHQIRVHMSGDAASVVGDLVLRGRPDPRRPAQADPAVAARAEAGLRPSRRRPVGGVHQPVSRGPRRRAGPAAGLTVGGRWRLGVLGACLVVALGTAWVAGSQGGPSGPPGPPPGSVRLGPDPGEDVAGYLARIPAELPPAGPSVLALVQFAGPLTGADALAAAGGGAAVTAVFQVPLPRVQTALAFEDLEPQVPPSTAVESARARAAAAAAARTGGGTERQRAVATAERAALADPACACVIALVVRGDRAVLDAVAARPGVRAVQAAPPGVAPVELALAPLLPAQTARADPLPDDGPVP